METGLDEAVRVPVEAILERLAGEVPPDVLCEHLGLEMGDGARLRGRHVGRVADGEDVRLRSRLQGARVSADEAEVVAEAGRALDVRRAAVERHRDEQVEGHLAVVVAHEPSAGAVHLARRELRDEPDALGGQKAGQLLGRDRLRERAVERRDERQLDVVAHAAVVEVPVGEERQLERRDRALDGKVDEAHDDPSAVERPEGLRERRRTLGRVEGEDPLHPARPGHAVGLLGLQPAPARHDEHVVRDGLAVAEVDVVHLEVDVVDLGGAELDAVPDLAAARADDLLDAG